MVDIYNSQKKTPIFSSNTDKDEKNIRRVTAKSFVEDRVKNKLDKKPGKEKDCKYDLPGHSHNPLSAYRYRPHRAEFVQKEKEEQVILLLRRHPITNLKWMVIAFLMIIAPAFFSLFSFFEVLPVGYQMIIIIVWYLIIFAFVFEEFLLWFFHVNIVTDERIFDVDFANIFFREMTDANIDQIQDVTVEVPGGIWTAFNVGNVIIQTASEVPRITFEMVPRPDDAAKVLRKLRVEEEIEKLEGRVR